MAGDLYDAETAKAVAGSVMGAGFLIHLRHPGSLARASFLFTLGMMAGLILGPPLDGWLNFGVAVTSPFCALVSLPVASGLLRAMERFDFSAWIARKGA